MKLLGRGIIISGASRGLGSAIAEACVAEGAHVLICARDAGALFETQRHLAEKAAAGQQVVAQTADVRNAEDVERLFETAGTRLPKLDGVVNNAGIWGPKGLMEDVDLEEWWNAIEINLRGVVLFCRKAVPLFRKQGSGKIVNLSGGGATAPMPRISAYAASKAAVVRFTETLAEETKEAGLDVNALAPGALNTRMLDEVLASGPETVGTAFYERALKQKAQGGASLERAAAAAVFLLSAASNGITGRLISAVWDPWESLPGHKGELGAGDIYTLRRILPGDRGLNWE